MRNRTYIRIMALSLFIGLLPLTAGGCNRTDKIQKSSAVERTQAVAQTDVRSPDNSLTPAFDQPTGKLDSAQPDISEVDWSPFFGGLNGGAVIFDPSAGQYLIYNRELAETRRSPCSTFKIISSLIGLEQGVIPAGDSTRKWSGETFWNPEWNRDIDFEDAFRSSCIWYFRDVIDQLGPETVKKELDLLQYGNCDLSDWNGYLNTNNNKTALRGFWVESSLKISAVEQAVVMERIFGADSPYSGQTLTRLKQVMELEQTENSDYTIFGKTGMGKAGGEVIDAWYTGFAETPKEPLYFCVYLGASEGMEVSSARAREIAVNLIRESPLYFSE